jgi:hypothetical protein
MTFYRIHLISSILVLPLLFSCAPIQQTKMADERSGIVVDVGDYTVMVPSGEEWSVTIDKQRGTLSVEKLKKWWTGKILGTTLMRVFQNKVLPEEKWSMSDEQVADDYRNTEEHIMKEADQRGEYDLKEVKKISASIGDKKLYAMSYKITKGSLLSGPPQAVEAMLYLYFPRDFKETHTFYGFLINESYERGSLVTKDLEQIYPVINSFQLKNK